MALSRDDFATAYRALAQKAATLKDVRRAFRAQSESGERKPLARLLVDLGVVPADRASVLAPTAPVNLRSDPASLDALGEMLIQEEILNEGELEKLVHQILSHREKKSLPAVPIPKSLEGYDFEWELGRGAHGTVYRGRRPDPPHECAIKVYRPESFPSPAERSAFLARVLGVVPRREPGFAAVYEAGEADGHLYVVMEFVEGMTIEALVAEHKLSLRRGFEMMEKVARSLASLHAKGEAHGSVTASTILIGPDDAPRISDLGFAGAGTASTDVFALGAVLYEIAAGVPPYAGFHATELKAPSRYNGQAAGAAERIVFKALARDPARRYADAGAMADDLRRFLKHEEVEEFVAPPAAAAGARSKAPFVIGAIAAALVLGFAAWKMTRPAAKPVETTAPEAKTPDGRRPSIPGGGTPEKKPEKKPTPRPIPSVEAKKAEDWKKKGPVGINEIRDVELTGSQALAAEDFDKLGQLCEEIAVRGFWDAKDRDFPHYWATNVHMHAHDWARALPEVTRCIELTPSKLEYVDLRIDIYLKRTENRKALADLATRYGKNFVDVNKAIQELTGQIDASPREAALFVLRGAHLYYKRNFPEAERDFAAAVQCGDSKARYFYGLALAANDQKARAIDELRSYLAAQPGDFGSAEAKATLDELTR